MIEVSHIVKKYADTLAVNDVSFSVDKGEIIGFLGPNGAGKSTSMKIITGYIPATSGTVTVDGFDVFEHPLQVKQRIGYMPETVPLYTDMTPLQYLHFMGKIKGLSGKERNDRVKTVIGRCALEKMQNRLIGKLSKGYRQRVGLAQALINDPQILILDEPSVGLDPHQIIEIRNLIKDVGSERTVILSSHILPEVSATCERVIIIHQGKLVASDKTDNLTAQLQGGQQLALTVEGPVDGIRDGLAALAGVKTVRVSRQDGHAVSLVVESEGDKDIRKALAAHVVENGWGLLELKPVGMSLEEIFLELTTKE